MWSQRNLLLVVMGLAAAATAAAQASGSLRWRAGAAPLGLQAGQSELRVPCGSFTISCDATTLPLYASLKAPRSLSMQVDPGDASPAARLSRASGLNVSVVGKAGILSDLGVYGRIGTNFSRATPAQASTAAGEGGLTYGVGLSWDFSRSGSAALGLDTYDVRGSIGDIRDVRTSLGLQWRY